MSIGINLFPKAVFLVVLLSYLKATEEFKATHPHNEESGSDHQQHSSSFKARFRESKLQSFKELCIHMNFFNASGQFKQFSRIYQGSEGSRAPKQRCEV